MRKHFPLKDSLLFNIELYFNIENTVYLYIKIFIYSNILIIYINYTYFNKRID